MPQLIVALKVLKPELAAVLGAERFVQEITTTASLSHPHILPLFDSGEADGFLFYVMPFVDGETLRGRLNRETQEGSTAAPSHPRIRLVSRRSRWRARAPKAAGPDISDRIY